MSDLGKCPICETELEQVPGIAVVCPNDDCIVFDDAALWSWKDGEPYRKEGSKITVIKDAEKLRIAYLEKQLKQATNAAFDRAIEILKENLTDERASGWVHSPDIYQVYDCNVIELLEAEKEG